MMVLVIIIIVYSGCTFMFDFLNNLTHSHQRKSVDIVQQPTFQDLSSDEEIPIANQNNSVSQSNSLQISLKSKKKQKKEHKPKQNHPTNSIVAKMQQPDKLYFPNDATVKQQQFKQLSQLNGIMVAIQTNQAVKDKEKKVFIREMSRCQQEYLSQAKNAVVFQNIFLKECLQEIVSGVINSISDQILKDKYQIKVQRPKYIQPSQNFATLKLIKQRQEELQDKIGELNVQFSYGESFVDRRAKQITSVDDFDPDSVKTKKAEEYIKAKQRQRQQKQARAREFKQKKRHQEIVLMKVQQQKKQKLKQKRHQQLKQQFQKRKVQKQERQQRAKSQQLHFKEFLKEYNQSKPLFVKKQQQYKKKLIEEKRQRYQILKQKQAKYQPLDLQTLEMHQQHYQELRKEDRERKQAEMQMAKEEQKLRAFELKNKVYNGKFRYLVLNQLVQAKAQKEQKKAQKEAILAKKRAYSIEVKEFRKPKIDALKKAEMQQMINSAKKQARKYRTPNRVAYSQNFSTIGSVYGSYSQPQSNPKVQGKRYHRMFKQYIQQKIQKGQIKKEVVEPQASIQKRPDYLIELRQKYSDKIPSKTRQLQRQIDTMREGDDYSSLRVKALIFEEKAKQRELKLRLAAHRPQQQRQLQQDYLCAVKAKIELFNHMN